MSSTDRRDHNLEVAGRWVAQAVKDGAALVVLPEKWNLMADRAATVAAAEPLDGPSVAAARAWARTHQVAIIAGSFNEKHDGRTVRNTSVAISAAGDVAAVYRKIHLFDVEAGGRTYRESDEATAGDAVAVADLGPLRVGMSICYDLRFPELYRELSQSGVDGLVVPAAFTAATGPPHWEVLLRARAIENQAFVVAAGQVGEHPNGMRSHGHSMVVDAWGTVLAEAPDNAADGVVMADVDLDAQAAVRTRLPALAHRRIGQHGVGVDASGMGVLD